jgi:hypothetical protein
MQDRLRLPMCNERFRVPLIPFFYPMLYQVLIKWFKKKVSKSVKRVLVP